MPKRYWRDDAACKDLPVNMFYGEDNDRPMTGEQVRAARAVCQSCPSQRSCLIHSMMAGEEYGVWGGFQAHERRTALARHNGDIAKAVADFDNGTFVVPRKRKKRKPADDNPQAKEGN